MNHSMTQPESSHDVSLTVKASPSLLSASTITGDEVCNLQDEKLGKIQDLMLDLHSGQIRYAVLSSGGFLGLGERMFAIPWRALQQDKGNKRFLLDVAVERLKQAPGFDKERWPNMADEKWSSRVESYYTTRADSTRA